MKTINLEQKEILMLEQTLRVPIETFGNEIFRYKLSDDYLEIYSLFGKIEKYSNEKEELSFNKHDVFLILKGFLFARDICDPIEFHTLTGFNWSESDDLVIKLLNFLVNSK
jgi:hypothetical protein